MIPFLDLTRRLTRFEPEYLEAVSRVMRSGTLLLGDETSAFEAETSGSLGGGHVVAVSSGAAAIQLTIEALGIVAGDEVIVPAFTAVPTVSAVVRGRRSTGDRRRRCRHRADRRRRSVRRRG